MTILTTTQNQSLSTMLGGIGKDFRYFAIATVMVVFVFSVKACDMPTPMPTPTSHIEWIDNDAHQRIVTDENYKPMLLAISKYRRNAPPDVVAMIIRQANLNHLDPWVVYAIISAESSFDQFARSNAGAIGFMQIMPFWKQEFGQPSDNLFDARTNIEYGCRILRIYIEKYGSLEKALQAYNGSLGKQKYQKKVRSYMLDGLSTKRELPRS